MLTGRIIVLNYNGQDLLQRFLPSVLESAKASAYPCAVSVLDNCSVDGSVDFLKKEFPGVDIYQAKENKVLCSYNEIVREVKEDIVLLLNNDIETERGFVTPLMDVFVRHSDALFAASYGDRAIPAFHWGILGASFSFSDYEHAKEHPGFTLSAGVAAFHRKRFLELEGYDEMYLPGIYEDVDLCYRSWKRGWRGYYEPASRKFHLGSASFSKRYNSNQIQKMAFRNGLLFMVKNITDTFLILRMALWLPFRLVSALVLGKFFIVQGFLEAAQRLPLAIKARQKVKENFAISDREILGMLREDIILSGATTQEGSARDLGELDSSDTGFRMTK
jgi:GT2 family glycosyltransferase